MAIQDEAAQWRAVIRKYLDENPGTRASMLERAIGAGRGSIARLLNEGSVPYSENAQRIAEFVAKINSGGKIEVSQETEIMFTISELEALIQLWKAQGKTEVSDSVLSDGLEFLINSRGNPKE